MKNLLCIAFLVTAFSVFTYAQGSRQFPGLSAMHVEMLTATKKITPVPLPTWLPAGFKVENVKLKLGSSVAIEDQELIVIYSRKLADGKTQRFSIEAGFEGIGDLPYDTTSSVKSAVGPIDIAYEPPDLDGGGKKLKDFAMTQWFTVGKTAFHYDGMYGAESGAKNLAMIPLADTRKILQSLQKF